MDFRDLENNLDVDLDYFRYGENKIELTISSKLEGPLSKSNFIEDKSLQFYSLSKDGILQGIQYDERTGKSKYMEIRLISADKVIVKDLLRIFKNTFGILKMYNDHSFIETVQINLMIIKFLS